MPGLSVRTINGQLKKVVIDTTSTNKLGGTINASIINDLEEIIVTTSGITSLTGGPNLVKIELNGNNIPNLSSIYPGVSSFTNLDNLTVTNDNALTGTVPSLEENVILKTLGLRNNNLTGRLPTFSDNPSLSFADFRDNSFSGEIPALSTNPEMVQIYFNNGNAGLSGFIPELSACSKLENFNVSGNGLSGRLHDFRKTPNLKTYHAFNNHLTGPVPTVSACPTVITLEFNQNYLSGGIPYINNLTDLKICNFNNNGLSGHFPEVTNLASLQFLRFNKNDRNGSPGIIGAIPDLSGCPILKILDVANCSLTGWNGTSWPSIQFNSIQAQTNLLPTSEVNRILAAINATYPNPVGSGYLINLAGTGNGAPTNGNSNSDRVALISKGWSVNTNT